MKEKKQDKLSVNEPNSIGEALSHSRHQVPSSALESQRQKVSKMTMKEKIDQMILNNECVPDLKDCLSYSSSDPTKFFSLRLIMLSPEKRECYKPFVGGRQVQIAAI